MREAFSAAKSALASTARLAHPVEHAELSLFSDASATHVGAVLQQRVNPGAAWEPLGFFSKKLDKPQLVYSAFDRELFAAYSAVRHFRFQLEGRRFSIHTDHKPLAQCLVKPWTPRQHRQLAYIAEFMVDICYVAGFDNIITDALKGGPAGSSPVAGAAGCGRRSARPRALWPQLPA